MTYIPKENHLPDALLREIGLTAALWSRIETLLEFCILDEQEIPRSRGLTISANLGFHSKCDILLLYCNEGGVKPEDDAKKLKALIVKIKDAYTDGMRRYTRYGRQQTKATFSSELVFAQREGNFAL